MVYALRPNWLGFIGLAFFGIIGLSPTAGSCVIFFLFAEATRHNAGGAAVFFGAFAVVTLLWASTMMAYIFNSFTYFVRINGEDLEFNSGGKNFRFHRDDVEKISLLTGGRGWRYIGVFGSKSSGIITNSLYSDNKLDQLNNSIADWMRDGGKGDIIDKGLNGPGKLGSRSFRWKGIGQYITICTMLSITSFIVAWLLNP